MQVEDRGEPNHIENREKVISQLKRELVGPRPAGPEIDCSASVEFEESYEAYRPYRQQGSRQEILTRGRPSNRYGIGVLNPADTAFDFEATPDDEETLEDIEPSESVASSDERDAEIDSYGAGGEDSDPDDFDLTMTNASRACSMAVSCLAHVEREGEIEIRVSGGRYHRKEITAGDRTVNWWLRSPVSLTFRPNPAKLRVDQSKKVTLVPNESHNVDDLDLRVEVLTRPQGNDQYLLTISLVNRTTVEGSREKATLFQSHLEATVRDSDGRASILPYPEKEKVGSSSDGGERSLAAREEEESLRLVYRKAQTFAVGHGCAADWEKPRRGESRVSMVSAECFPVYEAPSRTPEIRREDGSRLQVSMAALAGLEEEDGFDQLNEVVDLYRQWIHRRRDDIDGLSDRYHDAARRHMDRADRCAKRMMDGIDLLHSDPIVLRAFRLANHAILLQQIRSFREARIPEVEDGRLDFGKHPEPDPLSSGSQKGNWRPFQIAFLLMSLRSTAEKGHPAREEVELIWFPTGGGKTEAYLGLAAFSIFLRYLRDPQDHGVHVLMRYTLRLLTAQQFQRASGLICAMEHLREKELSDVNEPISIGIWLGGKTSPNTRNQAQRNLRDLQDSYKTTENKFVLNRCPWCGAKMGRLDVGNGKTNIIGYRRVQDTVQLHCPDRNCDFRRGLPIHVVDEDIYERRPDIIIGTVDKFAMLAWRPDARALFGLDEDGNRVASPPGLIVQDELHLISGPLGSMVGLYESLIEELCTDRRQEQAIPPKIISSTATIRRYKDQIKSLYARGRVTLFPPPGLEEGDSFFSRYATREDGSLLPGKKYIGIYAPGLPSLQTTQVRTFATLLMAPMPFSDKERDPWWTLLVFYNSLRELGGALSLFQSDIPEYVNGMRKKTGADQARFIRRIQELTGRISGEEVTEAIAELETTTMGSDQQPVDACLASSIVEVGVDIDRLSLIAVVGQPKTTSQYIQVTGRIGRKWRERPGLVTTLYSTSKPRDRSHFEKFRSYHERLYAQVEPTSVTPFSPPALDRALHAVMVAYVRQYSELNAEPYPVPVERLKELRDILRPRVEIVDPDEMDTFETVFRKRIKEWKKRERINWTPADEDPGLMHRAGEHIPQRFRSNTWAVPMNMRNVDAECILEILDRQ